MIHTIETVKRDLPAVRIKVGNKIVDGEISGRLNSFATVMIESDSLGCNFTWQTIVNSLNNDKPLLV